MERQLEEAVTAAKSRAMHERRQGILITRHDHSKFTVALTDRVPFGLTREADERPGSGWNSVKEDELNCQTA
jgi:predicted glycosyltransferase